MNIFRCTKLEHRVREREGEREGERGREGRREGGRGRKGEREGERERTQLTNKEETDQNHLNSGTLPSHGVSLDSVSSSPVDQNHHYCPACPNTPLKN